MLWRPCLASSAQAARLLGSLNTRTDSTSRSADLDKSVVASDCSRISAAVFSGLATWITYAEAGPGAANRGARWVLGGLAPGVVLIALSAWQLEYDLGIPQWQTLAQPVHIAVAGGFALTAARAALGRGGALITVVNFVAVRAVLSVISVGVWDVTPPRFPLYLGAAIAVELARAMAAEPKLLISDEAMAGLSAAEVDDILAILFRLNQQGITIIMIEHVMKAVMNVSDRIIVLDYGEHGATDETKAPVITEIKEDFYKETNPWPPRSDPFSTYRAGFEIRTHRRCKRVLMLHAMDKDGNRKDAQQQPIPPTLIKSTDFLYQEDPHAKVSFLKGVTQRGYKKPDKTGASAIYESEEIALGELRPEQEERERADRGDGQQEQEQRDHASRLAGPRPARVRRRRL